MGPVGQLSWQKHQLHIRHIQSLILRAHRENKNRFLRFALWRVLWRREKTQAPPELCV